MKRPPLRWALLIAANAAAWCVLSFFQTTTAAPPPAERFQFGNAIEQRQEIINQLKELNAAVKEQNAMLRSGRPQPIPTLRRP